MTPIKIIDILEIEIDYSNKLLIMVNGQDEAVIADKIEFDHSKGEVTITVDPNEPA